MASAWQTLEEAALTLGISSRTLHRRITKAEVETRLVNGRREVLVTVPDPEPTPQSPETASPQPPAPAAQPAFSSTSAPFSTTTIEQQSATPLSDDVGQTMLALHEDRVRRSDLAIMAYQQSINVAALDARRSRAGSRLAWSVAGGVTVALFLSVVYATHSVTQAQAQVENLTLRVQDVSATADANARAAETFRQQAEQARVEAARAQGELASTRSRPQPVAPQADQASATLTPAPISAPPSATMPPSATPASAAPATRPAESARSTPTEPTTRPLTLLDRLRGHWTLP